MTKKRTARPKRTAKHHRGYLAEFNSSTKDSTRVVARRWLKVTADDPAAIIAAARKLCPQWQPHSFTLSSFDRLRGRHASRERRSISLGYGTDSAGVYWYVNVTLDALAARIMAGYLMARGKVSSLMLLGDPPSIAANDDDDDGGEELSVPTISETVASRLSVRVQ